MIKLILTGVDLETKYAYDTMPRGILGLNAPMFEQYLQYIANRRFAQIGLPEHFKNVENPPNKFHITAYDGDAICRCMKLILNSKHV